MLKRLAWHVATQTFALACICSFAVAQETTTVHSPYQWPASQTEAYIAQMFGPQNSVMALAVSRAENSTRSCTTVGPVNKNGTVDYGVFQVNSVHLPRFPQYDLKRCDHNVQVARILFQERRWQPWTVYKTGAYQRFVPMYRGFTPGVVNAHHATTTTMYNRYKQPLPAFKAPLPALQNAHPSGDSIRVVKLVVNEDGDNIRVVRRVTQ